MNTVAVYFGNDVAISIFGSGDYTPPDSAPEQREWLKVYARKVGNLAQ
jgi:hypothetical protein